MFEKTLVADLNRFEAHLGLGLSRLHQGAARQALEAYAVRGWSCSSIRPPEPVLFGKAVALQVPCGKFPKRPSWGGEGSIKIPAARGAGQFYCGSSRIETFRCHTLRRAVVESPPRIPLVMKAPLPRRIRR